MSKNTNSVAPSSSKRILMKHTGTVAPSPSTTPSRDISSGDDTPPPTTNFTHAGSDSGPIDAPRTASTNRVRIITGDYGDSDAESDNAPPTTPNRATSYPHVRTETVTGDTEWLPVDAIAPTSTAAVYPVLKDSADAPTRTFYGVFDGDFVRPALEAPDSTHINIGTLVFVSQDALFTKEAHAVFVSNPNLNVLVPRIPITGATLASLLHALDWVTSAGRVVGDQDDDDNGDEGDGQGSVVAQQPQQHPSTADKGVPPSRKRPRRQRAITNDKGDSESDHVPPQRKRPRRQGAITDDEMAASGCSSFIKGDNGCDSDSSDSDGSSDNMSDSSDSSDNEGDSSDSSDNENDSSDSSDNESDSSDSSDNESDSSDSSDNESDSSDSSDNESDSSDSSDNESDSSDSSDNESDSSDSSDNESDSSDSSDNESDSSDSSDNESGSSGNESDSSD